MNAKTLILSAAIAQSLLLAGCGTAIEMRREVRTKHEVATTQVESLLQSQRRQMERASASGISDRPYVDVNPVRRTAEQPPVFSTEVVFNGVPLQVLAQRIEATTGIRISYQSELLASANASSRAAPQASNGAQSSSVNMEGLPPGLASAVAMVEGGTFNADRRTGSVSVSFKGSLADLLNEVSSSTGSSWEYDAGARTVVFYRYKTETFVIPAAPDGMDLAANMGGALSSSSGDQVISGASAVGTFKTNEKDKIWGGLNEALKVLVSAEGGYTLMPATNMILVRDRPDRLDAIRKVIDQTVASLSTSVDLEVNVYRVTVNNRDSRGVNFGVAFQKLLQNAGYNLVANVGGVTGEEGSSRFVLKVPEKDAAGNPNRYGGSEAFVDALAALGDLASKDSATITTTSNRGMPLKVVQRTPYLKETAANYVSGTQLGVAAGPTLTPGVEETGLNMFLLPSVQPDGRRLKLNMMMSLSTLDKLDEYGPEGFKIQLPNTSAREFFNESWLESGQMLVISGFEREATESRTRTPWGRKTWWAGGSNAVSKNREVLVVTVRPAVFISRAKS
ncbi:TPA: hypothetical protein ACKPYM_000794 [Stenotrophomonas maltophilia]